MVEDLRNKCKDRMDSSVQALKKDFGAIRTGRASLALLDNLMVEYYGNATPLNQVAALSVPESNLITIQPWDPQIITDIERSILKSDLGLTPGNDGKLIRITIPPLTEERRKQIVKVVRKRAEEGRISVRNIRRDLNDSLKAMEKSKEINEDDLKKYLDESQKLTDSFIKKVDETLQHKEKEIMEV